MEYNSPGGNNQGKGDVQAVETIESTRRSCCLQSGKERSKENVAVERARAAQ